MKKKLEEELTSIALRILQLKDTSNIADLQEEAKNLYEKLTILNYTRSQSQDRVEGITSGITKEENTPTTPKPAIDLTTTSEQHAEDKKEINTMHDTTIEMSNDPTTEAKPEIIIEKINEKVSEDLFIPATNIREEDILVSEPEFEKNDKEDIGSISQSMPMIDKVNDIDEKPISLNDQLKKSITIGLNDRLAFIKHLFGGSATDYNRVLSQLNTLRSKSGAIQFVKNMVKPDYNNWEGKEEYEERFMQIVINKFEF